MVNNNKKINRKNNNYNNKKKMDKAKIQEMTNIVRTKKTTNKN